MSIDRRSFLRGILTVSALSVLPAVPVLAIPTIKADGVHDDAPGLNAFLNGRPFLVERSGILVAEDHIGYASVTGGDFAIGSPVIVPRRVFIANSTFTILPSLGSGGPVFHLKSGSEYSHISNIRFDAA